MIKTVLLVSLGLLCTLASLDESLPLGERLQSMDRGVAMQALFDLARRGPPGSSREIEIVRIRLSDPDPNLRTAAASAAASLHDDGAVPQLIAAMRESTGQGTDAYRAALSTIAGGDVGANSADAWSAWHDGVIASTQASCSTIRLAVLDGKPDAARAALHPLLMQRAGRDLIVDLLEQLGNGTDARLVALAREGLTAIDTAAAKLALAAIDRGLPPGVGSASEIASAVMDQVGPQGTPVATVRGGRPVPVAERSTGSVIVSVVLILIGVVAVASGGWLAGREWLAIKVKAKYVTGAFIRKGGKRGG